MEKNDWEEKVKGKQEHKKNRTEYSLDKNMLIKSLGKNIPGKMVHTFNPRSLEDFTGFGFCVLFFRYVGFYGVGVKREREFSLFFILFKNNVLKLFKKMFSKVIHISVK